MKFGILVLIAISGVLIASLLPQAYSQLASNNKYLLTANGFAVTEKAIQDSELNLQLSTGKLSAGTTKIAMQEGAISVAGIDYLTSGGWKATLVFDGRLLTLSGDAHNLDGDKISTSLVGRLVQQSQDGSVYLLTGKMTKGTESVKIVYSAKLEVATSAPQKTSETASKEKIVKVSILPDSSKIQGQAKQQQYGDQYNRYYDPPNIKITSGTTIIWTNNDSVPHRVVSGVSTQKVGKPLEPDGKFDSGDLQPGQTFKITINQIGIIRFGDPTYNWMEGLIISYNEKGLESTKTTAAESRNKSLK